MDDIQQIPTQSSFEELPLIPKKNRIKLWKIVIVIILCSALPIGLILVRRINQYKSLAANQSANFYFSPGNASLPPNLTEYVMVSSGTTPLSFVDVTVTFDTAKVKLSGEVAPSNVLKNIIKKTSMAEANSTGRLNVVMGLSTQDRSNPPVGIVSLFNIPLTTATGSSNQTTVLDFSVSDMEVVDTGSNKLVISATPSSLGINVVPTQQNTPTQVATATPTLTPTARLTPTETPTPTVTLTPTPTLSQTGFRGQYFNNIYLSGTPVVTRYDSTINFNWGLGSPDPMIRTDNFSVRWTKTQNFAAGTYQFKATADDGIRVFVDGTQVINKWLDQAATTYINNVTLTQGTHNLEVDYYEHGLYAVAQVSWTQISVPTNQETQTFGLNSGNGVYNETSGTINLMRFKNTAGTGVLNKLELLFNTTYPTGKVRLGIYADKSGLPGGLILDAGEVPVVNGFVAINGLNLPVTPDTYYWLAFNLQNKNKVMYLSGQATGSHYWVYRAYGSLPSVISVTNTNSNNSEYVMRATVRTSP